MSDAPIEKVTVIVQGKSIILDAVNMKYNENVLGEYMNKESGWIDYLGKQLEFAQKEVLLAEIAVSSAKNELESQYSVKFIFSKDEGRSDNCAKAYANSSLDIIAIKNTIMEAEKYVADRKEAVGLLKAHLKAWDKNHSNVQNRSNTLRKELERSNNTFYQVPDTCTAEDFIK